MAQIFGVTADELLCRYNAEDRAEIDEYVNRAYKLRETDPNQGRRILEEALLKYPDNEILLNNLLYCVNYTENPEETIRIATRLINKAASGEIRYDALRFLAYAHNAKDDTKSAVAALEQVPELYFTKLSEMAFILSGEAKLEAANKQKWVSAETLIQMLWKLAEYYIEKEEPEKAVSQTEKALAVIKIFDDETENFKTYEDFLIKQLEKTRNL